MQLQIDLAFFQDYDLLCRGTIRCGSSPMEYYLDGVSEHTFYVTSQFEEPACPVEIVCHSAGKKLYEAALRVGVHTSEDWESINLADVHTLGFRCHELY